MSEKAPDASGTVESGPAGTRFTEIRLFGRLDSTNQYLLDAARVEPIPGLVATAQHQSAGRGRLGRSWEAPQGANLLASVLLVPRLPVDQLHLCSAALSLAAAAACEEAVGTMAVSLKWPNDLVVGERKLAGVLAETVPIDEQMGEGARAVVVGVGINVRWPPSDGDPEWSSVPSELRRSATSIVRESGLDVDPRNLLDTLLVHLDGRLGQLDSPQGRIELARHYRARCATIASRVRVETADGAITGTAVDVTAEGHLLVDVGTRLATVTAGDVVHVRGGD